MKVIWKHSLPVAGESDTIFSKKVMVVAPHPSQGNLGYETRYKSHDTKGRWICKNYIKIVKYRHTGLIPGTQASNLRLVSLAPYFHLCHQFPEGILCLPFLICWPRWSGCIGRFWFEFPKKFSPSSFSSAWAPAAAHLELTLISFSECDGNSRVSYLYSNFNIFLEFHQLQTSSLST